MATHFTLLAWRIPWTEKPSALPGMPTTTHRQGPAAVLGVQEVQGLTWFEGCKWPLATLCGSKTSSLYLRLLHHWWGPMHLFFGGGGLVDL